MIVGAQSNYVENPGFESGLSGWTTDNPSAAYTQNFPYEGAQNLANWLATPYEVTTYQTLTGLENGTYTLKVMAHNDGGQTACHIFARNFGGSELTADLPVSGGYVEVEILNIEVTNGQCEIGIYSDASAGQWCRLDNFSFTGAGSGGEPPQTIAVDLATATNEGQPRHCLSPLRWILPVVTFMM
jgi:arabinogalactan endo-1,4-beta-galactosidase